MLAAYGPACGLAIARTTDDAVILALQKAACAVGDAKACHAVWAAGVAPVAAPSGTAPAPLPPPVCNGATPCYELALAFAQADTIAARRHATEACMLGHALACRLIGSTLRACELGDVASCDDECVAGRVAGCMRASDAIVAKHGAVAGEGALPRLFAECEAQKKVQAVADDGAEAKKRAQRCAQTHDALENAIELATSLAQPRYGKLIAEMKKRCGACPE